MLVLESHIIQVKVPQCHSIYCGSAITKALSFIFNSGYSQPEKLCRLLFVGILCFVSMLGFCSVLILIQSELKYETKTRIKHKMYKIASTLCLHQSATYDVKTVNMLCFCLRQMEQGSKVILYVFSKHSTGNLLVTTRANNEI